MAVFAIPAGVIIDRADHRKLIARADLLRAAIVLEILLLAGLAFLLGSAEVLRDNAAQTILPSIVDPEDLEAANGQMWGPRRSPANFIATATVTVQLLFARDVLEITSVAYGLVLSVGRLVLSLGPSLRRA